MVDVASFFLVLGKSLLEIVLIASDSASSASLAHLNPENRLKSTDIRLLILLRGLAAMGADFGLM